MLDVTLDTATGARALADQLAGFGRRLPNAQALVLNRIATRTEARVTPAHIVAIEKLLGPSASLTVPPGAALN